MKEVTIKIKSAKIVNTDCKGEFNTVGFDGSPTVTTNDMENLIHFNHISNMIHVMMGSRPVSSRYQSRYEKSSRLDDIVKRGLIHYDNVVRINYTTKNGDEKNCYNNEFTQGNKPFKNSDMKLTPFVIYTNDNGVNVIESVNAYLTWSKIKERTLFSKEYIDLLNILNEFGTFINSNDIQKDYELLEVLIKVRKYQDWVNRICQIKHINPVINFIKGIYNNSHGLTASKSPNRAALSIINAVTPKVSVDATVVLFFEDEDAVNLLNAKGISSFLDNGYAEIVKIEDISHYDEDTFEEIIEEMLENDFIFINTLPYTKKHETEN